MRSPDTATRSRAPHRATRRTTGRILVRRFAAALLVLVAASVAASSPARAQPLSVAAASSLTDAFGALATAFTAYEEDRAAGDADEQGEGAAPLRLAFAASSTLATQIEQGAPFGVFASADEAQMARLADAGLLAAPSRVMATNRLVLLVAEGSGIDGLDDLARPGVVLVVAAPQVPAGAYAERALARAAEARGARWLAAVEANVASREPNVRQVAAKVALGEADAALVYATDVAGLRGVRGVELPPGISPLARYPVAPLTAAADPDRAAAFVAFVLSDAGLRILREAGFGPPDPAARVGPTHRSLVTVAATAPER